MDKNGIGFVAIPANSLMCALLRLLHDSARSKSADLKQPSSSLWSAKTTTHPGWQISSLLFRARIQNTTFEHSLSRSYSSFNKREPHQGDCLIFLERLVRLGSNFASGQQRWIRQTEGNPLASAANSALVQTAACLRPDKVVPISKQGQGSIRLRKASDQPATIDWIWEGHVQGVQKK